MGNSAKKQARKQEKQRVKQIKLEYNKKLHDKLFLFMGATDSGKTEFINQMLQIKYNTNLEDLNWPKNTYKIKSFTINQYCPNEQYSASQYKYLEIAMKQYIDFKQPQQLQLPSTSLSMDKATIIKFIRYYSKQIIPVDIIELIINFVPNPSINSYVFDAFLSGSSGIFELWDIDGMFEYQKRIIHELYEYLNAFLFIADLSGYDQYIIDDGKRVNKLSASLNLMRSIAEGIGDFQIAMILFLNKKDLFATKIESIPFTEWSVYRESVGDSLYNINEIEKYETFIRFIKERFSDAVSDVNGNHAVYIHVTNARDRNNVEKVFNDVQHIVIES